MTVLKGVRVLDLGGIGPDPFATMMLADMGAEVIRLDPSAVAGQPMNPVLDRGKSSVTADFKSEAGIELARSLAAKSDIVIEGFRPGAAERLGLGRTISTRSIRHSSTAASPAMAKTGRRRRGPATTWAISPQRDCSTSSLAPKDRHSSPRTSSTTSAVATCSSSSASSASSPAPAPPASTL